MAYLKDSNVSKGIIGERWLNNSLKGLGFKTHPNPLKEGKYCQQIGMRVDNYLVLPNGYKIEFEMKNFDEHSNLFGSKYEQQVRDYFDPRSHVTRILVITFANVPVKRCKQDKINVFRINSDLTTEVKRLIARRKLRKYLRAVISNLTRNIISRKNFLVIKFSKLSKYVKRQPVKPNTTIINNTEPLSKVCKYVVDVTLKDTHTSQTTHQTKLSSNKSTNKTI